MSNFRAIPSIEQLRQRPALRALESTFGATATVDALRDAAADIRRDIATGSPAEEEAVIARIEARAASRLRDMFRPSLAPIINATGIVVHTNLGRAPLADAAVTQVGAVARGYSTLEYDIVNGSRGRRDIHAESLLRRLTGAEAAVVVNNNAAAVLIVLAAVAAGREAIVSRGELVEIGGGFRVPDVMAQSGAVLREVGTTNKTRTSDYAAAITDRTALILRVHPSNFRIEGFTERPALGELVALGRRFEIPVAEDLGSGYLGRPAADGDDAPNLRDEPTVEATVAAGADVCSFSGDKLLGGPQAGIIVGRAAVIERVRKHPLMRALRVDKMTYAALEATLTEYACGRAAGAIPVRRMLNMPLDEIRARAGALARAIGSRRGWRATTIDGKSAVGGGSAPGVELPTVLVAIEHESLSPDALDERLRRGTPPIVARIENDRVVLDLRTVPIDQDAVLSDVVASSAER